MQATPKTPANEPNAAFSPSLFPFPHPLPTAPYHLSPSIVTKICKPVTMSLQKIGQDQA